MNRYPRECTRSESRRLPFHRCPGCGRRYQPGWKATSDLEGELDPVGTLDWSCPNEYCEPPE